MTGRPGDILRTSQAKDVGLKERKVMSILSYRLEAHFRNSVLIQQDSLSIVRKCDGWGVGVGV